MQIPKIIRIIAVLTILFINANTTISNEIYQADTNNRIDDKKIKTDNINIDSDKNTKSKDGLVMNENILNNNEQPQINEGTITTKSGVFSVIKESTPVLQPKKQPARIITPKPVDVITNAHRAKMSAESKEMINNDLVINYAAIDSDMNIEPIKTNGKVILMVPPDVKKNKQYDMLNVAPSEFKTEPEQNGISLTSSGKKYIKSKEITEEIQIHNLNGASISIERLDKIPDIEPVDKRQYMRFKITDIASPVIMGDGNESFKLLDISRGGVALQHNNLQVGNIIPVNIKYKDIDINTNIQIVSTKNSRTGARFINNDKATDDKLLYLSVLLESDTNMLKTKFSR